jgi:hypothetical protein
MNSPPTLWGNMKCMFLTWKIDFHFPLGIYANDNEQPLVVALKFYVRTYTINKILNWFSCMETPISKLPKSKHG